MKTYIFKTVVFFAAIFSYSAARAQVIPDAELKMNTNPISTPLKYVSELEPVSFEYNKEKFNKLNLPSGLQYGFIAEDVQQVIPGIVKNESKMYSAGKNAYKTTGVKNIDMESIIPILVGAIKEQQAEIEKLRAELRSTRVSGSK